MLRESEKFDKATVSQWLHHNVLTGTREDVLPWYIVPTCWSLPPAGDQVWEDARKLLIVWRHTQRQLCSSPLPTLGTRHKV
jgi:hypothetical protein